MKAFFYSIRNGLREVFSDEDGRLSSMRIGFFWILFFETFNQTWATFHGVYTPMNLESMGILVSAFFAKSWQKKLESESPQKYRRSSSDNEGEGYDDLPDYPQKPRRRL